LGGYAKIPKVESLDKLNNLETLYLGSNPIDTTDETNQNAIDELRNRGIEVEVYVGD